MGSSNPDTRNVVGFNNLQITCTTIVTDAPTPSPTGATDTPTKAPSGNPTKGPTNFPTKSPVLVPTRNPITNSPTQTPITVSPTPMPTKVPTVAPSDYPTEKPSPNPVSTPVVPGIPTTVPSVNSLAQTLDGTGACDGDFMTCNLQFLIVIIVAAIVCVLYWILGSVWYKRRQNNRPLPPHLMIDKNKETEMGTAQHATANKWKSDWELEQEAKRVQAAGGTGGDAIM